MKTQKGFTIIELMLVVMIIAILAALAIRTIQTYTVRAKVSEVISIFAKDKQVISEYYISQGTMVGSESSVNTNIGQSIYLDDVTILDVTRNSIKIEYQLDNILLNLPVGFDTIIVEGTATVVGVRWRCTLGTLENKYLPANCQ